MDETQERVAWAAIRFASLSPDYGQDEEFGAGVLSGLIVALGITDEAHPQPSVRASYDHGREMLLDLAVKLNGASLSEDVARYLEGLQP